MANDNDLLGAIPEKTLEDMDVFLNRFRFTEHDLAEARTYLLGSETLPSMTRRIAASDHTDWLQNPLDYQVMLALVREHHAKGKESST